MTKHIAHERANSNGASLRRSVDVVFFDGQCGLCHALVRFAAARRRAEASLRFAPLGGPTAAAMLGGELPGSDPDSVIVKAASGETLVRSVAVRRVLTRLGAPWCLIGILLSILPRRFADRAYEGIARIRRRLFARPDGSCPIVPGRTSRLFLP